MTARCLSGLRRTTVIGLVLLAPLAAESQQESRLREWSDRTGQFTVDAELLRVSQGKVTLRNAEGRELTVPVSRLSEADQLYLAAREREKTPPAAAADPIADDSPKSYAQVERMTKRMRSAGQVVELMQWASRGLASEIDRQKAAEQLEAWRERADQGLLRNGPDWVPPHEVDSRYAEEVRLLKEAHRLIDVKNDRLALDRFKDASRINPEGVRSDFYLGLLNALVAKHPLTAARNFDECVDRLESSPDLLLGARRANLMAALNNLAIAEVRTMKFDRAIRHWEEAINLSPQTPELAQNLGLLTRMGGTSAGSFLSNRIGDKAGELYARASVANNTQPYDEGVGWLYLPYIDDVDGTLEGGGDNELQQVGWSTGVAVAPDLVLVTARAVSGADRMRISKGGVALGEVVSVDPESDLALVRFNGLGATPMRWSAYEPRPATALRLHGHSQPGYGATGLRSLPTTIQDSRVHEPYEVTYLAYQAKASESGGAAVIVRQQRSVGGGQYFQHSFVGDPGLNGGVLCDSRGVGYAVHLGSRSLWDQSDAKSSLGSPASAVADFVGKSTTSGLIDTEPPTSGSASDDLGGNESPLTNTVFQVAALEFAPRLQWSHRIASQQAAGQGGWASYEDRSCMVCNGVGAGECPNRDCNRGRVTKYRTELIEAKGGSFEKQVPYKEACSTCGGRGAVQCAGCGGNGVR